MTVTKCPGLDCPNKVRVFGNRDISFCCGPCWEYSWSHTQQAMGISESEPPKHISHSHQCIQRQQTRIGMPYEPEPEEGWIMSGPRTGAWKVQR